MTLLPPCLTAMKFDRARVYQNVPLLTHISLFIGHCLVISKVHSDACFWHVEMSIYVLNREQWFSHRYSVMNPILPHALSDSGLMNDDYCSSKGGLQESREFVVIVINNEIAIVTPHEHGAMTINT